MSFLEFEFFRKCPISKPELSRGPTWRNGASAVELRSNKKSSHLSKWPSHLKINGTQENITFSGPVFHGLSCGVFLFVASVSFKNHPLNGWNFSTTNQVLLFNGF